MPKLYIGAPMTRMSAPRNSSSTSLPPSSAIPTAPTGAFAGRTVGRRLLSRCGIGLASRSRRITSRPGIAAFSAATNAAESCREAELAPVMLESKRCKVILSELETAEQDLALWRSDPIGTVRVSCPTGLAQYALARIVPGFLADYPLVRVQIIGTNRAVDLIEEKFDVHPRSHPAERPDLDDAPPGQQHPRLRRESRLR